MIEIAMSSQDSHSSDPEITVGEVDFAETVMSSDFALTSKDISIVDEVCCPPSAADPSIGMVVADRYRIIEAIGRGVMGIVYMVEHIRIGKLLAMKLLRGELSCRPDVVRRFKREALCVSRLQSLNTVQVFDFGVSKALTYLVMELVHGQNLTRVLQTQGPCRPRGSARMYRALTGYHPFSGEPLMVLSKHLNELPVPPHERAPGIGIPSGMSLLIMRALAKDPAERFQRVEDLQSLLVQEILAAGSSSVESLLDTDRVRRLAAPKAASATSEEVDAHERKLRRKRHGAFGLAALLVSVAVATGFLVPHQAKFRGVELEPNDTAAEATALALGQALRGQIGKRVDASHGDRDFYAVDLLAATPGAKGHLKLQISSLPTMATCVILYRPGFDDPVGQYCGGRPARDLVIPVIAIDPGRYLLVVLQDLDAHGDERPAIQESISDSYTVLAESVSPPPASEPLANEDAGLATSIAGDPPWSAALGWTLAPRSLGASGIRR